MCEPYFVAVGQLFYYEKRPPANHNPNPNRNVTWSGLPPKSIYSRFFCGPCPTFPHFCVIPLINKQTSMKT